MGVFKSRKDLHLNIFNNMLAKLKKREIYIIKRITFNAIIQCRCPGEGEGINRCVFEVYSLGSELSNGILNHNRI